MVYYYELIFGIGMEFLAFFFLLKSERAKSGELLQRRCEEQVRAENVYKFASKLLVNVNKLISITRQ